MRTLLLTLHVVAAIFLIGPLVAVANGAARAVRSGDAGALRAVTRTLTIYGWASLLVLVFGGALLGDEDGLDETWVVVSLILFGVAFGLVVGLLLPTLRRAVSLAERGGGAAALAGRAAAYAGAASLLYVVIAVLMVYQPD
jgi:uncharacterized membrane protein